MSDRGPGGGTLSYDTRVQNFTLNVDMNTGAISNFQVAQTIKFTNGANAFNELAPDPGSVLGNAFDPEEFVVNPLNERFPERAYVPRYWISITNTRMGGAKRNSSFDLFAPRQSHGRLIHRLDFDGCASLHPFYFKS